jgi:hypothetical protein
VVRHHGVDAKRFVVSLVALAGSAVGAGGLLASGCAGPSAAQPAQAVPTPTVTTALGQDVQLTAGQEATIDKKDVTVRFLRLVSDSRCKPGRECFWQGEATVALALGEPGRGERKNVELRGATAKAANFAACRIELIDASPDGARVTLRVTSA